MLTRQDKTRQDKTRQDKTRHLSNIQTNNTLYIKNYNQCFNLELI